MGLSTHRQDLSVLLRRIAVATQQTSTHRACLVYLKGALATRPMVPLKRCERLGMVNLIPPLVVEPE